MRREIIEQIVDQLGVELGPGGDIRDVEQRAVAELERLRKKQSAVPAFTAAASPSGDVVPLNVDVHLRVEDCAGRLASTVASHLYDKIRRLTSRLAPDLVKTMALRGDVKVPLRLVIHGAARLVLSFSASEKITVFRSIEQGALDAGFNGVNLLSLRAGKGESAVALMPLLPDLLRACPTAGVGFEVGSSSVGIRGKELLDLARILAGSLVEPSLPERLVLSCNAFPNSLSVENQTADVRVDLTVSAWPLLQAVAAGVSDEICYRDRMELLSAAGQASWNLGAGMLDDLGSVAADVLSRLDAGAPSYDGNGFLLLSVDHPDTGPGPSTLLLGLPVEEGNDPTCPSAAAAMLRRGVLAGLPREAPVEVVTDGLPLTESMRNVGAFEKNLSPPQLAGLLLRLFSPGVLHGYGRWFRLREMDATDGPSMLFGGDSTSIPVLAAVPGWSSEHFERGGAIVPPVRQRGSM